MHRHGVCVIAISGITSDSVESSPQAVLCSCLGVLKMLSKTAFPKLRVPFFGCLPGGLVLFLTLTI